MPKFYSICGFPIQVHSTSHNQTDNSREGQSTLHNVDTVNNKASENSIQTSTLYKFSTNQVRSKQLSIEEFPHKNSNKQNKSKEAEDVT